MEHLLHAEYLAFSVLYNPRDPCSREFYYIHFVNGKLCFKVSDALGIQGDKQCILHSEYSGDASFIHSFIQPQILTEHLLQSKHFFYK